MLEVFNWIKIQDSVPNGQNPTGKELELPES
jgi:hypothetical protein